MTLGQLLEYAYTGAAVRRRFADLEEISAYTEQWYDLSCESLDDLKLDILPFSDDPDHDYMSVTGSKI